MFFIIPEIADAFMLFFLARLLPAVTSASVATFFFFSCLYVWGHK